MAGGVKIAVASESSSSNLSSTSSDENPRGTWGGKMEFLLSCVGYAVGLGNVWRFPYLCYRNGGGAFLIPYLIMLLLCGLPLFFMELAFGQFSSLGPIAMWRASPLFKGVGWSMVMMSFLVTIYYNMIIAWTLYYFFASMTAELPWQNCGHEWNTQLCATIRGTVNESVVTYHEFSGRPYTVYGLNQSYMNSSWLESNNMTLPMYDDHFTCENNGSNVACTLTKYPVDSLKHFGLKLVSPAEEYWNNGVLRRSSGIDDTGPVLWDLALCLLLAWIVVFLCLAKGVKSSGKVVYFTATFPYIVLTILLIRGALLEGSLNGVLFYITPKWEQLATAGVWKDAANQIFYSLGVGFGGLHVMASYNKFNNNCLGDAITVALINCGTSVYAGFAIFSMIGYLSFKTGVSVDEAATSGPGLAFVAYPEGLSMMPFPPIWSILFFFMLFTLGLDSQFVMLETVICGVVDEFKALQGSWLVPVGRRKINVSYKTALTGFLCFVLFLVGLPMCTPQGVYWFQIIDWYSASHCLLITVFVEIMALMWVYGWRNFLNDIQLMLGYKPIYHWSYFLANWLILSPAAILFILIFAFYQYSPVSYEDYVYPPWGESVGWLVACASMVNIPLWAILVYCFKSGQYKYVILATKSEPYWGPALAADRENTKYKASYGKKLAIDAAQGKDNDGFNHIDTLL